MYSETFVGKRSVGQTIAKRVQHLLSCKGAEVAVAHIDIFRIAVLVAVAEIGMGGIVRNIVSDGIGELSGGGDISHDHICHRVAALLSALPDIQHGAGVKFRHPLHVDDVAHIEDHDHLFKMCRDTAEHISFRLGQQIALFYIGIVLFLTCCPADDDDGGMGNLRRLQYHLVGKGHFHLRPRLFRPTAAYIKGIFLLPLAVDLCQLLIQHQSGGSQTLRDIYHIADIHQSAGAGAAFDIVGLDPAKNRHLCSLFQGQRLTVIFQQYDSLAAGLAADRIKFLTHIKTLPQLSHDSVKRAYSGSANSSSENPD